VLDLHHNSVDQKAGAGYLWPRSHLQTVLGEMYLMDFLLSRLATHVDFNTREIFLTSKELGENVFHQIRAASPLSVIPVTGDTLKNVGEMIHRVNFGPLNPDLAHAYQMVKAIVDDRSGVAGTQAILQRQARTMLEAQQKNQVAGLVPDNFKDLAEDWQSQVARAEYHAARRLVRASHVVGIVGAQGSMYWDHLVATRSVAQSAAEFEARIESGSAAKPNKLKHQEMAEKLAREIVPSVVQMAIQTGDVPQAYKFVNAVTKLYFDAYEFEQPEEFLLQVTPELAQALELRRRQEAAQAAPQPGVEPAPQAPTVEAAQAPAA
jgi:hypothetical protein